jgi:organic radical activating enzyme
MLDPKQVNNKTYYPAMEHFYSIQGEGFFTGTPAYFIRLAGCDVGCTWCDVKESWEVSDDQYVDVEELLTAIDRSKAKNVIITGGEPTMYNLEPLTRRLKQSGYFIHLETSGAYPLSGKFDWVCVSPKRFKPPIPESLKMANELKMIVVNKHDLTWGTELAQNSSTNCKLFFQPEWDRKEKTQALVFDFIKDNPQWRLSLQIHKYLNIR